MSRTFKNVIILSVLLSVVLGAAALMIFKGVRGSSGIDAGSIYTVERGVLEINLTEIGTIKSRGQFVVKSEVEGRTSIIYVIDEGVQVKKGDLLIELDSSGLQDRLVDQQIKVENTEADFVSAKENLEVVKIQSQSNIAKASLENQFAQEDEVKYIKGEWPKSLMESETELTLAQEDFRRATDEFDWSKKLYNEKYLSETEYRADELALKRAGLQVALASEKLSLLTEFTHIRKLAELAADIIQKELSLERVRRESSSDIAQAQARLRAREAELTRQKGKLEKNEDQLSKTKMHAPADGMVVYATSSQFSWRGDTEPLNEGQDVRERQELIHLPTADSMMVVIRVPESSLSKVQMGQDVQIHIDALPDSNFTGKVTKIALLPDATSVFMNPDLKVYNIQIMIDGVFSEIRTGMSCKATILVDKYDEAYSVPLQAVVGKGGQTVVYVIEGNQAVSRVVETGLDNNAMVHVLSGLSDGDRVLLTPPLGGELSSAKGAKGTAKGDGLGRDRGSDGSSSGKEAQASRSSGPGKPTGKRP
ncbi:MAG: efflux RND transporter periplasmic adaptor subunit [Phycisphaerales bacterium]|nr:efflux RND transporter periplasmic adaptor subunit [Phycisphaerales bacterium]